MTREEQLEYCRVCRLRKFDRTHGLICSLTNAPADFTGDCPEFELDEVEDERLHKRNLAAVGDDSVNSLGHSHNSTANKNIGVGLIVLGIVVSIVSVLFEINTHISIWGGAISTGAFLYWRGLSQDKVNEDRTRWEDVDDEEE
ncbi:MAG: hypothetical protein GC181_12025 [Bacteroidetes bacterium]|nr:hypothetical protein [Bacteroidota bacterium]